MLCNVAWTSEVASLLVLMGTVVAAAAGGCVLAVHDDRDPPPGPCDQVECSEHGYCEEGECFCAPGYLGDPYAAHGCQLPAEDSPCQTTCGLNSYCDGSQCVCAEGFVSVCGNGDCLAQDRVCDGVPDCADEGDEAASVCKPDRVMSWQVADGCDDGLDAQWRLWASGRDWVWPGPEDTFWTTGGQGVRESIECVGGEMICFGARAGDRVWGVDLDASLACEDCCYACTDGLVDIGVLACE